jgi:hypothetical protein
MYLKTYTTVVHIPSVHKMHEIHVQLNCLGGVREYPLINIRYGTISNNNKADDKLDLRYPTTIDACSNVK